MLASSCTLVVHGSLWLSFCLKEPEELSRLQSHEWGPIIEWFNRKYNVSISAANDILFTFENDDDKETLKRHLRSYSYPSLQGQWSTGTVWAARIIAPLPLFLVHRLLVRGWELKVSNLDPRLCWTRDKCRKSHILIQTRGRIPSELADAKSLLNVTNETYS